MTHRRLPAEWEEQSGIMLTWPQQQSDWSLHYHAVEKTYVDIVTHASAEELVLIVCADEAHLFHVQRTLSNSSAIIDNLRFAIAASNDTWARDHGPITVFDDNAPLLMDFVFNGWGNKYPSDRDNVITRTLYNSNIFSHTNIQGTDFVLEGGSIESDGMGTLLTTTQCLLSPSRNAGYSKQEIEKTLNQLLGIQHILWLQHGELAGDDTDGHIDTLARFCDKQTIAYVSCDNPEDEQYTTLKAMAEELKALRDDHGAPYRLVQLPLPSAIYNESGERLPATYANFLILNNTVLVPTYNDDNDDEALAKLSACFPDRKITGIDCCALIQQYGSLHCATMQFPKDILV